MAKNKLYSFIKIGGFAFGIAICMLIVLYIKQETSYNKFYPTMDRIYRLVVQLPIEGKIQRWVSLSAPVAPTLKAEIPSIEQTGRILPNPLFGAGSNQLSLNDNPQSFYDDGFVYIDQSILDMFPTPMVSGTLAHALDKPNTLVITKSKAEKYFKNDPIGQTIYLNNNRSKLYTITGVIEDIPKNSTLAGYSFFMSLAGEPFYPGEQNQWLSNNYTVYVKLKPNVNIEQTEKEILKNYKAHYLPEYKKSGRKLNPLFEQAKINLQNALDIHLKSSDIDDDKVSTLNRGDIRMVWTFATVALFILLIACINFINLSTANATTRAKEIGIRKTIGSTRTLLIGQFLLEAICYSVLSLFVGLLLSWFLLPIFNNLANKSLTIPWTSPYFFPLLLLGIIFIGSLAGIYPALYLSRFKPIAALKNKTTGAKSSLFRNGLVVFQFATSIILIVSALVTNQQIRYILEKDLGFKKEQVIVLRGIGTLGNQIPSLKNELKSVPNVNSVSLGDFLPVPIDGAKRNGNPFWIEGRREIDMATQGQFWEIDQDYLATFGLQLTKGRNFDPNMATDSTAAIINQKLADDLGLQNPIGAKITNGTTWTVVGVVDNFIFESLKGKGFAGLCMVLRGYPSLLSIKVKPENLQETLNGINRVWNKFSPDQKINYSFLDEGFASLYQDVERTKNIFSCFAIVAIFVAALGLFGLATYVTQQRTKEIGVRKVLGASTVRLLKLLSGDFIKLVFVALVIASPVAWWAMNQWLRRDGCSIANENCPKSNIKKEVIPANKLIIKPLKHWQGDCIFYSMAQNDFKLAWRKLLKNKGFTFLNIIGLTLGFTGFILSYQYINRETSFDRWNPNYKEIYQVGLEAEGGFTNETSPSFAPLLKQNLPDIVYAGRKIVYNYGSYPLFGEKTVLIKNAALIDSSAARIFQIENANGPLYKNKDQKDATMVKSHIAEQLFKKEDLTFDSPHSIPSISLDLGMRETIYGSIKKQGLSMIDYDLLFIREPQDIFAENNPFLYQTFVQVRPGTDIAKLTDQINTIYHKEIAPKDKIRSSGYAKGKIYLDPLANLHLRPKTGSNTAYIMTWIIGILSVLILLLASANFANMIMAQADQRLKELALKKILGSSRWAIVRQLLLEVFILTSSAAVLSFITLALTGNILQRWFNDDLRSYILSSETIIQLCVAVLLTTILSAIYPAIVLSGFKSVNLLKGGLTSILKKGTFRNALLTFQISMAILFISGMLVIRAQLQYMQHTDKGFEPAQVINFKGVGMYYDAKIDGSFHQLKRRLENDPSIEVVASATNIPGEGEQPPKMEFSYAQKNISFAHVGIDPGYFKTLNIPNLQGNINLSIDQLLRDSLSNYAVINESAAKSLGLSNPIGAKISGCDANFEIVGLVKDSKAYGFENAVQPTLYSFKNECGSMRIQATLMVKTRSGMVDQAIETVKKEWTKNTSAKDLPLDYSFMDQQYALQHKKQQELQVAFNSFTSLSVIIAALGLFSMAAYQAALRKKEMGIRKVLGASAQLLFVQLNKPFFRLFLIGIGIALPLAYLLMDKWLSNFAYHVNIQWWSFLIPIFCIFILILISISFQSLKVARTNPVDSLRDE